MSPDEELVERARPAARRRLLTRIARVLLMVWLVACIMIYAFQRRLVYHPSERIERTPADRLLEFEDVHLDVGDGDRIHAWWVPLARAFESAFGVPDNIEKRLQTE